MVRKTIETLECDKCGQPAQRYSINFPEGSLVLDRCEQHGKKLEGLKTEQGEWVDLRGPKASFRKTSPEELREAVEAGDGSGR